MPAQRRSYTTTAASACLLLCCLLALPGCKNNPQSPTPSEPQSSVILTAPKANDVFYPGTSVRVTWELRPGAAAPDSVYVQFRRLDPETAWQTAVLGWTNDMVHQIHLADSTTGRFEVRVRGNGDEAWDTATPLFSSVIQVTLTSPIADQRVAAGSNLLIAWALGFPAHPQGYVLKDTGFVEIQYSPVGGQMSWQTLAIRPATAKTYVWKLPEGALGDFVIRIRSTFTGIWSLVAPVHLSSADPHLTLPKKGSVYRVGSGIPLRWDCETELDTNAVVQIEVDLAGWKRIGNFPYAQKETRWTSPSQSAEKLYFRIRNGSTGTWTYLDSVFTADLRILDFPAGTIVHRGAELKLSTKVDVPWDTKKEYSLRMSSDGGQSWPIAVDQNTVIFDYPAATNCRFLMRRDDLAFGDTSAVFSIAENLMDYPILTVGKHYVYAYTEMVWRTVAGGTQITPVPHPDLHIVVHEKSVLSDKTVYRVSRWNAGASDTVATTIEEAHAGLHILSADFMPYSIERVYARLDAGYDSLHYRYKSNDITISRKSGLVRAEGWTGNSQQASEHWFSLK